jgi:Mrp family chromosome partitioning ATPase
VDLEDVLRAVRRGWWVLLGCVLIGLGAAAAVARTVTPTYVSSTQLYVASTDHTDIDATYQGNLYAEERSESYARALTGLDMAGRVIERLDLSLSPADVANKVTAVVSANTVIVEVTVTDSAAGRARDIAAALGDEFVRWVVEAETPPGSAGSRVQGATIEAAQLPTRPASPQIGLLLGLGGSLGTLLGLGLIAWGPRPWNTVTSEQDVRRHSGAPLIGALPDGPRRTEHEPGAQVIRGIGRTLGLLADGGPPRVLVVAGTDSDDGAATLAGDIAGHLARDGARVVLVDADVRRGGRPDLHAEGGLGFSDVLAGTVTLAEVVRRAGEERLSTVTAGRAPAETDGSSRSPHLRELVDALRGSHDHVVVHAPPVLSSPDAAVLGALADGSLLAVGYGRTRRGQLADAAAAVSGGGGRLLAVVLTRVPRSVGVGAGGSYRYRADGDRADAVAERRAVVRPRV